ncbi:hypothetical protein O181_034302 [Austropuccinia psidii MF-1]|uniref:Deacetylase sirtuin-type domain-containing protein n=1 Tax=Austropuccinia psidii MF-1 TaxID=1389203 RepID=A0A9Q3D2Z3_9BASI|nr:hypothetical protein [Austropuccinia psidii MF-1]
MEQDGRDSSSLENSTLVHHGELSPDESPLSSPSSNDMMDWKEWEAWMSKLQRKGLNRFLTKYAAKQRFDIDKFLLNLEITISIAIDDDEDEEYKNLAKIQTLILIKKSIIQFLNTRKKLSNYNTLDDLVSLIQRSSKILVLTGAGISTSCGIPDFRSQDGLYSQLQDYEDLDDAYDMFDLNFFKSNPKPFYRFSKTIFPFSKPSLSAQAINPSDSHKFIKMLESKSKLLRNYTQNIDTLETRVGVENVVQCHGSFATFTCLKCLHKFPGQQFEDSISQGLVVLCQLCSQQNEQQEPSKKRRKMSLSQRKKNEEAGWGSSDNESSDENSDESQSFWVSKGLVKPDIIFFGEGLPKEFHEKIQSDRLECDLVLVMGTSLAVAPVSEILEVIPPAVPQILINRDPIRRGINFDIYLLGESDLIVREICKRLGDEWKLGGEKSAEGSTKAHLDEQSLIKYERLNQTHIWLFEGSNKSHPWLEQWKEDEQETDASEKSDEFTSDEVPKEDDESPPESSPSINK